ncbi:hypothetical protein E2C01_084372 [Portunus trituberculatus]|uniref:Uncharacterized protein n=1 Tax=Portunus trituberculatus TaxID=210409 RepID=A0A5B7J648_PORTR|nr:hypothetical protein [Portunus trituberculatus]
MVAAMGFLYGILHRALCLSGAAAYPDINDSWRESGEHATPVSLLVQDTPSFMHILGYHKD